MSIFAKVKRRTKVPSKYVGSPHLLVAFRMGRDCPPDRLPAVESSLLLGEVGVAGTPGTPQWEQFMEAFKVGKETA